MTEAEAYKKLASVCMPHAVTRLQEIKSKGTKFAHYTSAYAALQIIEKQTVWMRNALLMNDFSEVQHGQACLANSWHDEQLGGKLKAVLDRLQPGLSNALADTFDNLNFDRQANSYLISISEHGSAVLNEEKYGRLSMWRAYGGNTNVAFVFNNTPFISESNALMAFTSPVLYCDETEFPTHFSEVVNNLEENFELLEAVGPNAVLQTIASAFHFAALSTKHPGFAEEKEWRVIHSPTIHSSPRIGCDIETINGAPQLVYKLKMEDYPSEGFVGATLPDLLEEIIIGPTQSPLPVQEAFVAKLTQAGVKDAWDKVRISDIPLRR